MFEQNAYRVSKVLGRQIVEAELVGRDTLKHREIRVVEPARVIGFRVEVVFITATGQVLPLFKEAARVRVIFAVDVCVFKRDDRIKYATVSVLCSIDKGYVDLAAELRDIEAVFRASARRYEKAGLLRIIAVNHAFHSQLELNEDYYGYGDCHQASADRVECVRALIVHSYWLSKSILVSDNPTTFLDGILKSFHLLSVSIAVRCLYLLFQNLFKNSNQTKGVWG